ncbi:PAP2 superfamily protein [Marivirga sericea]|uniref:PAP2 superfamily protein n=1 Tax=Marivirga sericea TaxID=1028 RepID=A0A1X7JHV9_9BACT|nr:vanadium-dependent haloperoxidase [Marivirga sericea]SMG27292.1 PAP2 superfamily protein [Marivirga sericea]
MSTVKFISLLLFLSLGSSAVAQQHDYKSFKFSLDEKFEVLSAQQEEKEIELIIHAQRILEDSIIQEINYWNNSYPSYRWHQILMEIGKEYKGHKNGGRVAILHLAIYDALVEVWKHKQFIKQARPYQKDKRLVAYGKATDYSSFICEWSAAAGVAHQIIPYYFPESKGKLDSLLIQFKSSRLKTALQFPTDIQNGITIGRTIAQKYIKYAENDGTEAVWSAKVPEGINLWSGTPSKWDPMKAKWKPLTLESQKQFRPGPPPENWEQDMEELREFNKNNATSDIAWKWKSLPIWDELLERKILEYNLEPFESSYATALFHAARFDATIAAWDGKYHYWTIRPFQYDPEFKPILVQTPNFPGYPAGHTTVAGALAEVLAHLFPRDESMFRNLASECSESRFEGGVHFRTDNEIGLEMGRRVGEFVIENFQD